MSQPIKLKTSSTPSATPSTGDLILGEVAVNTNDGKVYIKKDDGTESVIEIGGDTLPTSASGVDRRNYTVSGITPQSSTDLFDDSSQISYWKFDEDLTDENNNYNGTATTGSPTYLRYLTGHAIKMDGTDIVEFGDIPELDADFTFSFKFNPNELLNDNYITLFTDKIETTDSGQVLVSIANRSSENEELLLTIYVGGKLLNYSNQNLIESNDKEWYDITISKSDNSQAFYFNGELIHRVQSTSTASTGSPFRIGEFNYDSSWGLAYGLFARARLFSKVLSDSEVKVICDYRLNSINISYDVNYSIIESVPQVDVYVNDNKLTSNDIVATTGSNIEIKPGLVKNDDNIDIIGYESFQLQEINFLNKTSNYTALNNDYIYANTDAGSFTITLPLNPINNDKVTIHDVSSSFATNNLIVDRNGETIMELSENMNLDRDDVRCTFIYNSDWRVSL